MTENKYKQKLKCYNRIDEHGRFINDFYLMENKAGQADTHTYSYLYMRNMYKDIYKVDKFGLELILGDEE